MRHLKLKKSRDSYSFGDVQPTAGRDLSTAESKFSYVDTSAVTSPGESDRTKDSCLVGKSHRKKSLEPKRVRFAVDDDDDGADDSQSSLSSSSVDDATSLSEKQQRQQLDGLVSDDMSVTSANDKCHRRTRTNWMLVGNLRTLSPSDDDAAHQSFSTNDNLS